jgi:probable addiction module antidote protein
MKIRRTGEFNKWLKKLRNPETRVRINLGLNAWEKEIPATIGFWGIFRSCVLITAPVIVFITEIPGKKSLSCFVAATKLLKLPILLGHGILLGGHLRNRRNKNKMEKITIADFDPAEYIETPEDVFLTLKVAAEENDPQFLLSVLGDIARSKGMVRLARELNLDRKGLYKALSSEGNPSFITVAKVLDTLGFRLKVEQKISA